MFKKWMVGVLLLFCSISMVAAFDLSEADALYDRDDFAQAKIALEAERSKAANGKEEAEVLWRLARVMVGLGDDLDEEDKDGKFRLYEEGEAYALLSLEKAPSAMAYLWKSSNSGRWGQTKGPLNALGKAKGMLGDLTEVVNTFNTLDSTETWYVLSSLYDELPGGMISFGDKEWAISYMRMAMDTLTSKELYPGHYKKLAEELYARNWSASKRTKELKKMQADWQKASTNLERYRYYEGKDGGNTKPFYSSVPLTGMSDRQEAVMVLSYILEKYKVFRPIKASDTEEIAEIEALRSKWV
ncbi:MAG: hypothetical protein PHY87_00595 [Sphaerochaeta sp.]|uniref:hypothetical protein n=1 Tax=Sphaerochaeta sp. TaxID=1972642 RepID=UPI001D9F0269|nr:hypothetical protein [Sphaerochaeta sp.]MDD3928277.1 hypothetical protein [Sphaerochaeta sp.]NCC12052.1 hypothetical protein [Spirochaetia bacterium]NCC89402.1 hypothetical protein [Spirochaetia bacterium]